MRSIIPLLILCFVFTLTAQAQQPQSSTAPDYAVSARYVQGVGLGYRPTRGTLLTLNLARGSANCSGTLVTYAGGTLSMTGSTTNYVYLNVASSCVPAVSTSSSVFATNIPIATVVTTTSITTISDWRGAPTAGTNSTGAPPGGVAGGDLGGTYPNPTVTNGVTQGSNASSGQICTYTGANKICVASGALPNGVTATTQSAADNSTKVATTAYVDAAGGTATIASGAKALATSAIGSAACTSAQTDTATGTATTDTIIATFNGDPTAVTGYVPLTTGMLTIIPYPTTNTVNFKVCNNTSSSITPGAITLNWKVVR